MDITEIIIEESPWFILLCILCGALYAFFLYQKKNPWTKTINRILAFLRFVLVTILCYLLLVPLIKQVRNLIENPILVVAIDNSESMFLKDTVATRALMEQISSEKSKWKEDGFDVEIVTLNDNSNATSLKQLPFEEKQTNLASMLRKVGSSFENRNLVGTILVSDGINNYGFSPEYVNLDYPLYTVGIGDTTIPNDVAVRNVMANKIAYSGNKFPVRVEVGNKGFKDQSGNVSVYMDGRLMNTKTAKFSTVNGVQEVEFLLSADKVGKHQIAVEISKKESEWNVLNNRKEIYIEVIDARQRILLYAHAPHPDIKAIKNVVNGLQNYEFDIRYEGDPKGQAKEKPYDLVIYHQVPSRTTNLTRLQKEYENVSSWFITGAQSDYVKLNQMQSALKFTAKPGQPDNVFPAFNPNNDQFNYENEYVGMLGKYPPIEVPFGEFKLSASTSVVLYQRIGSIQSDKPLLCVSANNQRKTAVFIGEGMWKWRMMEYAQNENFEAFDALISKTLQYVATANDKRKLRVYPVSEEFSVNQNAQLDIEVYNDIFEPLYNKEITLDLTHNDKNVQYKFVNSENESGATRVGLGDLDKGVYNFTASTTISGKKELSRGSFIVKESNLEALNTTADFNLLRQLADNNQGKFYPAADMNVLSSKFLEGNYPNKIINSFEELKELIHAKWLFFLLLGLATIEWTIRKYHGSI